MEEMTEPSAWSAAAPEPEPERLGDALERVQLEQAHATLTPTPAAARRSTEKRVSLLGEAPPAPSSPRRSMARGSVTKSLRESHTSQRSSYLHRSGELAREYVDDEGRDGCTSCPPSWDSIYTFICHVIRALFPFLYLAELLYRWAVRKVVIKCARKECGKGWCERRCERSCRCCQRACCRGLPCHWDAGPLPGHKVIMVSKQLESFGVKRGAVGVVSWEHQDKPSSSEGYVKVHWEDQELQNTMKYTDLKLPKEQGGARLGFDRDGKPAPYPRKQCCKKRCLEPDKGEKWAKKQKLVTVRRMAECLGWLYYFLLAYLMLCRSADFQAAIQRFSDSATSLAWVRGLLVGTDPWENNHPHQQQEDTHSPPTKPIYVDVALSITYYPLCAYLLLVILHAHEETSYPRRKRIERSVETDSILYVGVRLIKYLAHDVNQDRIERKKSQERLSGGLVVGGSMFLIISLQVFVLWLAEELNGPNGVPFQWLGSGGVLGTGIALSVLGIAGWYWVSKHTAGAAFSFATPNKREVSQLQEQLISSEKRQNTIDARVGKARQRIRGRVCAVCTMLIGAELIFVFCFWKTSCHGDSCDWLNTQLKKFPIVYSMGSLLGLGIGALMINIANSNATRWADGGRPKKGMLLKGDRVQIGPGLLPLGSISENQRNSARGDSEITLTSNYVGMVGTVIGLPDSYLYNPEPERLASVRYDSQTANLFKWIPTNLSEEQRKGPKALVRTISGSTVFAIPPTHCVVEMDQSDRGKLKGYLDARGNQGKCALVPLENICDVDWATSFKDTFADITERELRKLSFENEKYGERYSRRFRELQCTPIASFHLAKFDTSTLDQLIDIYMDHIPEISRTAQHKISSYEDTAELESTEKELVNLCAECFNRRDGGDDEVRKTAIRQSLAHAMRAQSSQGTSISRSCEMTSADVEGWVRKAPNEAFKFMRQKDSNKLAEILRGLESYGATNVRDGAFFKHFTGSLIFEKQKRLVSVAKSVTKGAVVGVVVGTASSSSPYIGVVGALLGGLLGFAMGLLQRERDETAHHLATHILDLHGKMVKSSEAVPFARPDTSGVEPEPERLGDALERVHLEQAQEVIGRHEPKPEPGREEVERPAAMFADNVGKMILYLSKARQFKRRVHWRAKIWYIAIAHAALPFVYTFLKTMPDKVSLSVAAYVASGVLVYLVAQSSAQGARRRAAGKEQNGCVRGCKWLVSCAYVILPMVCFVCAVTLSDNTEYLGADHATPDVCSEILDQEGQCCCSNERELPEQLRSFQCCASEFLWELEDKSGKVHSGGSQVVSHQDKLTCMKEKLVQCDDVFDQDNGHYGLSEWQYQNQSQDNKRNNSASNGTTWRHKSQVCFGQEWLNQELRAPDKNLPGWLSTEALKSNQTVGAWCEHISTTNPTRTCKYLVAKPKTTACKVAFHNSWWPWSAVDAEIVGCLTCGGELATHLITFWANATFTFAVISRLYSCYEDYFLQYHRMLYFLHLTPWATMKHIYKDPSEQMVRFKHEHWGLLPTFDLDSTVNIVAWNKLRLFLQTYELRSSRRLQVSVVYLLLAWAGLCAHQTTKVFVHEGAVDFDIETVFVLSTTLMFFGGLSGILFTGKWINDITAIGFPHVLNVKRAELLDKSSHYLVEHDFWNGHFLHSERATPSRQCVAGTAERAVDHPEAVLQRAQQNEKNAFDEAFYDKHDTGLLAAIEKKTMQDGLVQKKEMDMESQHQTDPHAFGHTTSEVRKLQDVGVAQAALEWMDARLVQPSDKQSAAMTTQCYRLLESFMATVQDEYGSGSRGHWGAEDRRTKLWFIVMSQRTIGGLFLGLLSGLSPVIAHFVLKAADNL